MLGDTDRMTQLRNHNTALTNLLVDIACHSIESQRGFRVCKICDAYATMWDGALKHAQTCPIPSIRNYLRIEIPGVTD